MLLLLLLPLLLVDLDLSDRLDLEEDVLAGSRRMDSGVLLLPLLLLLKVCRDGTRGMAVLFKAVPVPEDLLDTDRLGVRGALLLFMGVTDRSDFPLKTRSGFRGGDRSTRALPDSVRSGFRLGKVPVELLLLREGSPFLTFGLWLTPCFIKYRCSKKLFSWSMARVSATKSAIARSSCIPLRQAIRCVFADTSRTAFAIML